MLLLADSQSGSCAFATGPRRCEILHKDAFVLGARRDGDPAEGMDALVLGARRVRDPAEGCYCIVGKGGERSCRGMHWSWG